MRGDLENGAVCGRFPNVSCEETKLPYLVLLKMICCFSNGKSTPCFLFRGGNIIYIFGGFLKQIQD